MVEDCPKSVEWRRGYVAGYDDASQETDPYQIQTGEQQFVNDGEPARYLSMAQVAAQIGVSPSTIRDYQAKNLMPIPDVIVGDGELRTSPGWLLETITEWDKKIAHAAQAQHPNDPKTTDNPILRCTHSRSQNTYSH